MQRTLAIPQDTNNWRIHRWIRTRKFDFIPN